ncbi:MAG: hypothetical protein GF364_08185 [Candidatus Lokiarchaeota archaeon]|nr:hypothetical protein [Candidatus Lokiarchaeota archaeon]
MKKNKRVKQLKFIASIFNLALNEIQDTLGFETLTMIFRRVGEASGLSIAEKFKGRYTTIKDFGNALIRYVINPIIGDGKSQLIEEGDKIIFKLDACPYKKAGGFPIQDMSFFCHYTEGMIDTAIKTAFPDLNYQTNPAKLIANGCEHCKFVISKQI